MADRRMFSREILESSVMHSLSSRNPEQELESQRIWEALILLADDYGRGRLIPQNIRMKAFGSAPNRYMAITIEDVMKWLKQIEEEGAIQIYEVENQSYFVLTGWDKYQSGKWYKKQSHFPDPPGFVKTSKNCRERVEQRKGIEGKGREKKSNKKKEPEKSKDSPYWKRLKAFCKRIVPSKCSTDPQHEKQTDALDKLIRIDKQKIDTENEYTEQEWQAEVFAVLKWARADDEPGDNDFCWSTVFQAIPGLRDNGCQKYINMRARYLAATKKKTSKTSKLDDPAKFKTAGPTEL